MVGNRAVEERTGPPNYDGDAHNITSFYQWKHNAGKFYDCPAAVLSRYPPQPGPSPSTNIKSQQGEDKYVYQLFFSGSRGNNTLSFIEIGALDGVTFSNSFFFEKSLGGRCFD